MPKRQEAGLGSGAKVEPEPNKASSNFFKGKQRRHKWRATNTLSKYKRTKLLTKPVEKIKDREEIFWVKEGREGKSFRQTLENFTKQESRKVYFWGLRIKWSSWNFFNNQIFICMKLYKKSGWLKIFLKQILSIIFLLPLEKEPKFLNLYLNFFLLNKDCNFWK